MQAISSHPRAARKAPTPWLKDLRRDWQRWSATERMVALWLVSVLAIVTPAAALLINFPVAI